MTNNNGEIEVRGAGLPVWDPAGAEDARTSPNAGRRRTRTTNINRLPQPEEDQGGSLIISCKVVFPESLSRRGGRLSGLELVEAEEELDWVER